MLVNFNWLVEGILAGSGQIGGRGDHATLENHLDILCDEGIRAIVSLTEWPLELASLKARSIVYLHLPIPDMHPPALRDIIEFNQFVDGLSKTQSPIVVHCSAGLGRTGTMLASHLVKMGSSTVEALGQVRKIRPGSVETLDQELAIYDYEVYLNTTTTQS
ncbi:MAG: dual specificity protein phosphatase family protein [Candidatus Latescibacterota bacterium]